MRREGSRARGLLRFAIVAALVVVGAAIAAALLAEDAKFSGDSRGARIERFDLNSKLLDQTLSQTIIRPAGGSEDRPLLIFLHGRGGDPDSNLSDELFTSCVGSATAHRRSPWSTAAITVTTTTATTARGAAT